MSRLAPQHRLDELSSVGEAMLPEAEIRLGRDHVDGAGRGGGEEGVRVLEKAEVGQPEDSPRRRMTAGDPRIGSLPLQELAGRGDIVDESRARRLDRDRRTGNASGGQQRREARQDDRGWETVARPAERQRQDQKNTGS